MTTLMQDFDFAGPELQTSPAHLGSLSAQWVIVFLLKLVGHGNVAC